MSKKKITVKIKDLALKDMKKEGINIRVLSGKVKKSITIYTENCKTFNK